MATLFCAMRVVGRVVGDEAGFVGVEVGLVDLLLDREHLLARLDRRRLARRSSPRARPPCGRRRACPSPACRRARRSRRCRDHDAHVERLAAADAGGHVDLFDGHFAARRRGTPARRRCSRPRRRRCGPRGSALPRFWLPSVTRTIRLAASYGKIALARWIAVARSVYSGSSRLSTLRVQRLVDVDRRHLDLGVAAEHDHGEAVAARRRRAAARSTRLTYVDHRLPLVGGNAERLVEQVDDRQPVARR